MRRLAPVLGHDRPGLLEVLLRIDQEHGHVDHVIEGAAGGSQHRIEILEGAAHLGFEVRLGRTVLAAADLAGNEQEAIGPDRRRVAVALVQGLAPGGENDITL